MNKIKAFSPEALLVGPDILLELHQYATANGFEVFLGGGAVRDQVHGSSPKDLDIGVINCPVEHRGELIDIVMMQNWDVSKVYNDDDADNYAASFPGEEDRYECIWQFESLVGGLPLDLLFYTDAYPTIASVMASHDHSINQYAAWYGSLGLNVAYLGDQSEYGHCRQLRHSVTAERIHKVKGMCQRLGWTYEALPVPPPPPIDAENGHDYLKYAGTCKEACEALQSAKPHLRLVRGHYLCPMWGPREHWWLEDTDLSIVDPTVRQFPTCGAGAEYVEFDGNCSCEQCGAGVKEEDAKFHGNYAFCSDACILRCVGL